MYQKLQCNRMLMNWTETMSEPENTNTDISLSLSLIKIHSDKIYLDKNIETTQIKYFTNCGV